MNGEVQVTNWSAASVPSDRKKTSEGQRGSIHLRLKDASLAEMTGAFSTPAHPMTRLGLGGTTEGTVDLRWSGDVRRAEAEVALDVTPAHAKAGQLPVTAKVRGKYRAASEELELTAFDASTPASQVRANGPSHQTRRCVFLSRLPIWRNFSPFLPLRAAPGEFRRCCMAARHFPARSSANCLLPPLLGLLKRRISIWSFRPRPRPRNAWFALGFPQHRPATFATQRDRAQRRSQTGKYRGWF